jgi:hypothetical protein
MATWPSGLRRYVQVVFMLMARVQIPQLSIFLCFFFNHLVFIPAMYGSTGNGRDYVLLEVIRLYRKAP